MMFIDFGDVAIRLDQISLLGKREKEGKLYLEIHIMGEEQPLRIFAATEEERDEGYRAILTALTPQSQPVQAQEYAEPVEEEPDAE